MAVKPFLAAESRPEAADFVRYTFLVILCGVLSVMLGHKFTIRIL
jgi:hypothetical protein